MTKIIEDGEEIEVDLMAVDASAFDGPTIHEIVDADAVSFRETADGYLTFEANFARTGIQEYLASELGMVGDGIKRVYRPAESVFDASSVRTFSSRPITLQHPPELVTPDNVKDYAVGWTGTKITRNGDMVRGSGIVTDRTAIDAIKSGQARQLSMGYTLKLDATPGTAPDGTAYDAIQRDLRMNHLAIVPRARGGSKLKIGDNRKETEMTTTVMIDGVAVKVADGVDALTKALADHEAVKAKLADAEAAQATADANWKDKVKQMEDEIARLKKENMGAEEMDAAVESRAALLADAAKVAPAFDTKGKSADEIRKGVVAAIAGDKAVADKSADYIAARFDALADGVNGASLDDPFAAPIKKGTDAASDADTAYEKMLADMAGAWKTE